MDDKKKILIVEDEAPLRKALEEKFIQKGFATITGANGDEGLRHALTDHPDIILLDNLMPIMDGMTVLKKLREDNWGKTVPVILLTNFDATDEILRHISHDQPSYYLIKSDVKLEEIVEKVYDCLKISSS